MIPGRKSYFQQFRSPKRQSRLARIKGAFQSRAACHSNWAVWMLVLVLVPFLAGKLIAADATPPRGGTNAASRGTTGAARDVDPDAPPPQVEDDRAREEAADRASRRTLSELLRGPYLQS